MSISAQRKSALIKEHARGKDDTGSPEVQVAILSERINTLSIWIDGAHEGDRCAGTVKVKE